ncbi:hypothetical protein TeGR_g2765 [Tetraparma gracilis]|uniref:NIF system FeS cluster assembly NifU C-terminal domain-containing protein n=1 Tax=Tetraparma gracilis TaxID=2962635 RepID=A0ABQ6ML81_9STRA|nr:hypothetical protein TeGR_g2765 [Tetraparma gracilis]
MLLLLPLLLLSLSLPASPFLPPPPRPSFPSLSSAPSDEPATPSLAATRAATRASLLSSGLPPDTTELEKHIVASMRAAEAADSLPGNNLDLALEHRDVPTAHKGLHEGLYGDGDDHGATQEEVPLPKLAEETALPYKLALGGLPPSPPGSALAAVYAVFPSKPPPLASPDPFAGCSYVGLTRNLHASLASHLSSPAAPSCGFVRARSFPFPNRKAMSELQERWQAYPHEPDPAFGRAGAPLTEEGRRAYEATKEKLRRAMADGTLVDEAEEKDRAKTRRRDMRIAAGGDLDDDEDDDEFELDADDWSGEIAAQTAAATPKPAAPPVSSPFAAAPSPPAAPAAPAAPLAFTPANVDKVLDEIRPYLISDGGNVSVHSLDEKTRGVNLVLEGACGSCPSSTTTMRMGIERVLKENFENLGPVEQVSPVALPGEERDLPKAVTQALEGLRPAIEAMGGVISLKGVSDVGVVTVGYRGSNKVRYGLELAVRDVEGVKHVEFVDA